MHQPISLTIGVVGLLALTLFGRGLLGSLYSDLDLDFSLRQSRTERPPVQLQVSAERSRTDAAPLCARP